MRRSWIGRVAVSAAALGLLLAGCGGQNGDTGSNGSGNGNGNKASTEGGDKPESITVWRFGDPTGPHEEFMDSVGAEFEEQTGVAVEVEWIPWAATGDKLAAAAAGQEGGPDVTEIGNTQVLTWANQGVLADITDRVAAWDEASGIPENLWSYEKLDDGTYAVPWLGGSRVVYYRTDWFDELDLEVPTSWEELEAAAVAISDAKGDDVAGFAINGGSDAMHTLAPFIWGNGGELAVQADDGTWESKVAEPAAKEAVAFYSGLVTDSKVSPKSYAGKNSVEIQGDFIHGKVGMYVEGSWGIGQIIDPENGDPDLEGKVGTFPLPAKDGGVAPQFAGGNDLAVWQDSQNQDVAFDYIELIAGKEWVAEYAPIAGLLPEYTELLESAEYADDPALSAYAQAFAEARGYPTSEHWVEVDENKAVMQAAVRDIINGEDVDVAMEKAAAEIDELLNQ